MRSCTTITLLLLALRAEATSLFDPALHFRQLSTEHFVVYFHQGENATARRLAAIAEETWRTLQTPLGVRPPAMTRVVLVDQTELFNGYATPLPRDTIVIFATWPQGTAFDVDDWLRVSLTHEFTHIVHLARPDGCARFVRGEFRGTAIAIPNLSLPLLRSSGRGVDVE